MPDLFDIEAAAAESSKKIRIDELADLIKKYQNSYYNGEAEISDAEFDRLWDELKVLQKSCSRNAYGQPGKSCKS